MQQLGCTSLIVLLSRLVGSSAHATTHIHIAHGQYSKGARTLSSSANAANPARAPDTAHRHDSSSSGVASSLPMMQLMSLSLDRWGSSHNLEATLGVDPNVPHNHLRPQQPHASTRKTNPLPLLSLMSVSLDTWGYRSSNHTSINLGDQAIDKRVVLAVNPLAQVPSSEFNLFDSRGFEAHSMNLLFEPQNTSKMVNIGVLVFILSLVAIILSCLCWDGSLLEDEELHSPRQEVEQDFATLEFSDGSWAQVYREACGEKKEALELLFRCNIISTDEFAFSCVSKEHIEECIWIATHMLRQKPLEEWVALWQQAQQTFEDSVTACFEARGGPHSHQSSGYETCPPMILGAVPLARGGGSRPSPPVDQDEYEEDPYTTRSHYTPHTSQDPAFHGISSDPVNTQSSLNTNDSEQSRWSIESELNNGLALHNSPVQHR